MPNDPNRYPLSSEEIVDWLQELQNRIEKMEAEMGMLRMGFMPCESSASPDIAERAANAVASGPKPQLIPVIAIPQADTDLTPMDETHSQSVPLDPKSHSAPYLMSSAWGKLPFVIEAALSEGIAWTSISEAIKTLINAQKNGA